MLCWNWVHQLISSRAGVCSRIGLQGNGASGHVGLGFAERSLWVSAELWLLSVVLMTPLRGREPAFPCRPSCLDTLAWRGQSVLGQLPGTLCLARLGDIVRSAATENCFCQNRLTTPEGECSAAATRAAPHVVCPGKSRSFKIFLILFLGRFNLVQSSCAVVSVCHHQ